MKLSKSVLVVVGAAVHSVSFILLIRCIIKPAAVPPRPLDGTVSVIVLFTILSSGVTDCNF